MSCRYLLTFLSLSSLALAPPLPAQTNPSNASQSMRAFMESPMAMEYYKRGGATYVKNHGDQALYAKLSYDYPDFAEATFTDDQGKSYTALARYNRESRKIEALLKDRLFAIKEADIPEVTIGARTYRATLLVTKNAKQPVYLEVQAQADDGRRYAAKGYLIYQSSNQTENRGIVTPSGTEAYKLDSVSYLVGFRELPFEVPRQAKLLVSYLDACEARALKANGRYKWKEDEFMRTFLALVSECE